MTVSLGATLQQDLGLDVVSLLVFARIVDCGSISRAAAELRLSRSAASRRLTLLERRLGTRLLARTTRRLAPTEAGQAVLEHCRRIAEETRGAADAVAGLRGGTPRGLLRVGLPPTLGKLHVLPHLGGFLAQHPGLTVQLLLTDLPFAEISRRVDLAVRVLDGAPEGFVARPLRPVTWRLVAAPAHLAAHGLPRDIAAVARQPCLIFSELAAPARWTFGEHSEIRVDGPLRANNLEALLLLALQGAGLALLPDYALEAPLADGRLVVLLPEVPVRPPGGGMVRAVYPPQIGAAPRLRSFLGFLEDCLGRAG